MADAYRMRPNAKSSNDYLWDWKRSRNSPSFSPYIFGPAFTAADCAAYMHFMYIKITTLKIYGENMLDRYFPDMGGYVQLMDSRPHVKRVLAEREMALAAFLKLDAKYEG